MTTEAPPPPACGATIANRRQPGHQRRHLGQHLCVAEPHVATVWHRCWCGYLWGVTTDGR